ncbi:uncharacterized protein LOC115324638 isoform X1 [Ixodes scapularis]|uniref:uncharacterized protein LOC115324638 isoform X1 n=1 Tax=Ixodes scapularis TaxID=6945 RepID=UPI001C392696|nr:uncharacterized protein LOC115324638 isoform X1 [Ixodes scapularis]
MPSTTCSAVGCSNNSVRNPELQYHQFPRDQKRRKVWVDAVRRTDFGRPWTPSSNAKLCSEHFAPDSYARDLRLLSAAGFSTKHASLKKDAVPSLFAYRPPAAPARAAYYKRQRIEIVNEALAAGPSAAACAPPADACSTPEAADDGDAFAARASAPPGDASTAEAAEGGVMELDSAMDVDEGIAAGLSAAACTSPGSTSTPEAAEAEVVELGSTTDVAGPDTVEASVATSVDATCSDMGTQMPTAICCGRAVVVSVVHCHKCTAIQPSQVNCSDKSSQTMPDLVDTSTETSNSVPVNIVCGKLGKEPPPVPGNRSPPSLEEEGSDSESDSEDDISEDDRQDPTYSPDEGDTDSSGEDSADESEELNITGEAADPVAEPKFIVPLSRLLQLLAVCFQCLCPTTAKISRQGPLLRAVVTCVQGHKFIWESQPRLRSRPLLALLLCGAITFSGASPTCVLRLLSLIGIATVQKSQYFRIQSAFLFPAALKVWKAEQAQLVQGLQGKTLCLAGDGRADSPGYSAKYGTYSLMEMNLKRIIHFELVQSTEVKSSSHMEKEGLRRGLDNLLNEGLIVGTLITDRHIGVKAMMTTDYPNTKHRFDAWHLAKGVISKVTAAGKGRNKILLSWVKSIRSHVYWCAQTSGDNGDLILAKWCSLMRHVANIHLHQTPLYPACSHGDIGDRWWLQEGKFSKHFYNTFKFDCFAELP